MIYNELPIAFPWYDNQAKQNRFRENVENVRLYGLLSPKNALLPFEFYRTAATAPTVWKIRNIDTGIETDISAQLSQLEQTTLAGMGRTYFYYPGTALGALDLTEGFYESYLTFGAENVYSEIFRVPNCSFAVAAPTTIEFLKLTWYNMTDINPIFYNDFGGDTLPFFKNVVYLDTFIHAAEPEIERETEPDGGGNEITTFERGVRRYRITDIVPDFLKTALVFMQMHGEIILTTRKALRSGSIKVVSVTPTTEQFGAFSSVEIIFEDEVIYKKGCAENMA